MQYGGFGAAGIPATKTYTVTTVTPSATSYASPGIGKGALGYPGIGKGALGYPGIGKGALGYPGIGKAGVGGIPGTTQTGYSSVIPSSYVYTAPSVL